MELNTSARPRQLHVVSPHPLPDPRRAPPEQLAAEMRRVAESPIVAVLLEASDATLLLLNAHRQIVAASGSLPAVHGLRPGEALGCVNAQGSGGCGTTRACQLCGALGAILEADRTGLTVESELLMRSGPAGGTAREFNVRATPISLEGSRFTVVSLRDISAEKRLETLEQVFFHDLLNTVSGLRGWARRLVRGGPQDARAGERIDVLSRALEREIRDHRTLLLAERGSLQPAPEPVAVADVLREVEAVFSSHPAARDRRLELDAGAAGAVELHTDPALLARVLVNMVRNALEATPAGGTVRAWVEHDAGQGASRFCVHNGGEIPPEVQPRVFQRFFSTKGERGRGLGTHGMKLLGERYLGGEVSFVSTRERGTVFSIRLPVAAPRLERAVAVGAVARN